MFFLLPIKPRARPRAQVLRLVRMSLCPEPRAYVQRPCIPLLHPRHDKFCGCFILPAVMDLDKDILEKWILQQLDY